MPEIQWIKITTEMFDDEKIRIIEGMPEADTLIVLWVRLICMAGKTNDGGRIYLNTEIGYTDEQLASIFNRPLNTVRLAINTFLKLGMIQLDDNGVIFLPNFEKHQSIEKLELIREQTRKRVASFRQRQKVTLLPPVEGSNVTVTQSNAVDKIRIDKNILEKNREEKESLQKIWGDVLTKIKERVNGPNFKTNWENLAPVEITETEFIIGSPSEYVCTYLENNAISLLEKTLVEVTGGQLKARLVLIETEEGEVKQ